jgi:hypothetical protein
MVIGGLLNTRAHSEQNTEPCSVLSKCQPLIVILNRSQVFCGLMGIFQIVSRWSLLLVTSVVTFYGANTMLWTPWPACGSYW